MNTTPTRHYHSTIIVSACIVAAAVITGALLFTTHQNGDKNAKPTESVVRQQFAEQLKAALQVQPTVLGTNKLKQINITDLRYHTKQDLILVEFTIDTVPPVNISGSCILSDDGFRRYTGEWGRDTLRVKFLIK